MQSRGVTAETPVVIVGAGPAGLAAALELARAGVPVVVVESDSRVGGLAQTVEYKGFRFDIGGHRFFTNIPAVRDLWRSVLGSDFLQRPRRSRIFYDGRFFTYPLKPLNALRNLGPLRAVAVLASYLRVKAQPIRPEVSFEDWVSNRFGRTLYRIFFETYTEKVWGMPGSAISARWASQRIQNFSLGAAMLRMVMPWIQRRDGNAIKTLIQQFEYPRLGPGMMWEAFAKEIERLGGMVLLNARVDALVHDGRTVSDVDILREGARARQRASTVISTMPLCALVDSLGAATPERVQRAARSLSYRDFLTVALVVNRRDVFPDTWIYIHDPRVKVGRIQNFKNWSPDMVPDPAQTCLGLEYFCTVGDDVWSMSDEELVRFATAELQAIGLVQSADVIDGAVVRAPKAYPIYDDGYAEAVKDIREHLEQFTNLQTIGRNGTHTYNNQDHSMVMGMLAARNVLGERHDVWRLNSENEYLEEVRELDKRSPLVYDVRALVSAQPLRPSPIPAPAARMTATR